MFQLKAPFSADIPQQQTVDRLLSHLESGQREQTLLGITGSGKTYVMAKVIAETGRPALILAPNKTLAAQLYQEMCQFFPDHAVRYFVSYYDYYQPEAYIPSTDTFIEKDAAINEKVEQMRLAATKSILEQPDTIIVASVSAIYGLGAPEAYVAMVLTIEKGQTVNQSDLLRHLAQLQYIRNQMKLERGTFRCHGDVIDVHPADHEQQAVRIYLFVDQVEKIDLFDPTTGQVIKPLARYSIYPKTHYVTPKSVIQAAMKPIRAELEAQHRYFLSEQKFIEAQRIKERVELDLELMQSQGYCSGIEHYSRHLTKQKPGDPPPTLMDYLPKHAIGFLDESHLTLPQLKAMYRGDQARKQTLVSHGFRLPSAMDNRPLKFEEFMERAPQLIYVSATPGELEVNAGCTTELIIRPTGLLDPIVEVRPAETQVQDVLTEIENTLKAKNRVLLLTLTKRFSEDITEYLMDQQYRVRYLHSDIGTVERAQIIYDFRAGKFDILVGINLLREGLDMPEVSLVAVFDADQAGFLRSKSALIQIMGRAARHVNGRAILYADNPTVAMQEAIFETQRRRDIQEKYNQQIGRQPKSIVKPYKPMIDGVEEDEIIDVPSDPQQREKLIKKMRADLQAAIRQEAYLEAAKLRDQIKQVESD
jgi:excinuclease ABC subunit B